MEHKLLCQLALFVLVRALVAISFCEEVLHEVELLAESALNEPCAVVKEFLEVLAGNNLLRLIFRHLGHFIYNKEVLFCLLAGFPARFLYKAGLDVC